MNLMIFGAVLLIFGFVLKKFPPDYYTQRFYGYRTPRSQRDESSWNKSNRLAARYMIIFGLADLIIGYALVTLLNESAIIKIAGILLIPVTLAIIFFLVEKQL
ncbi:SdpI family protein [Parafilimonas sp.]|uniref:SdpI family protein n=1 Tax=Parafilimonas sp. TaxID=1969739 RepID=UPI0039E42E92